MKTYSKSIKTITEYAQQVLQNLYQPSETKFLIRMIFEHLADYSYTDIIIHYNEPLEERLATEAEKIIQRLAEHEPIQYILGYEYFMGRKFMLDNSTLIPRPETEELVKAIIEECKETESNILDIGTGSGCIAISLAKELPNAKVSACDISPYALKMAKQNSTALEAEVEFIECDILNIHKEFPLYNIIVSNPPYITEQEKIDMEDKVLLFEPSTALFVPNNEPLLFYTAIAKFGIKHLLPNGELWFEINRAFGEECCAMLKEFGYQDIELRKDIYGNNRIIKAIWR